MRGPNHATLADAEALADYYLDPRMLHTQRAAMEYFDEWSPAQYGHRLVAMKDYVLPARGLAWHVTHDGVVGLTIEDDMRWAAYARKMYRGAATGLRRLLTNTIEPAVAICPSGLEQRDLLRLAAQVAAAQASAENGVDALDAMLTL